MIAAVDAARDRVLKTIAEGEIGGDVARKAEIRTVHIDTKTPAPKVMLTSETEDTNGDVAI